MAEVISTSAIFLSADLKQSLFALIQPLPIILNLSPRIY